MKKFRYGLWFLFFLFSTHTYAVNEGALTFNLEQTGPCRSLSIGFSVFSDHTKKGDRDGLVNQHNHGKIGECFLDKDRRFYMLTAALTNSQWGPTLVHGYGIRFRSPQVWRLSVEGGYEGTLTYYEQGCPTRGPIAQLGCSHERKYIIAPLPILYLGASFELPSLRQVLAPFLSQEEAIGLPHFMQLPMGELTIGRRTLGAGLMNTNEKIYLYNITWTKRF